MKYYRLMDELNKIKDRWFLKSLNVVDENKISVWKFLSPAPVNLPDTAKLKISVREIGKALDFTFADFEVLIVNEKVAFFLSDVECQLLPVEVGGVKNEHSYFVVVILNSVDCLDESRSVFEKWQSDDPIRPDLAGDYKGIYKLFVDPNKINPNNTIFRLGKSDNVIIVSEKLKKQFESNGITGVKFKEVT
jgi:hypothetical protein